MKKLYFEPPIYTFQIDFMRHVSNIVYVQWMEIGRSMLLDAIGMPVAQIATQGFGPVLVETDLAAEGQVRLPKVSVFGKDQNFLWRDTPASWRTDAILAATQSALLPDSPAELREGWIRVAPEKAQGGGA